MVPKKEMEKKNNLYDECDNYPQDEERKKIDVTRSEDPAQHFEMIRHVYPESAELDSCRLDTSLNPASGSELVLIPRASDYLVAAGAAQRCHSVGALPLRSVPVYLPRSIAGKTGRITPIGYQHRERKPRADRRLCLMRRSDLLG
jgi:hypothetical protein